jgi:hypothetical protein
VYKKIEAGPELTTLDMLCVSPQLLNARNLELAVPGKSSAEKHIPFEGACLGCRDIRKWKGKHNDFKLLP